MAISKENNHFDQSKLGLTHLEHVVVTKNIVQGKVQVI